MIESTSCLQAGLVCGPAPQPPPGAHGARNARVCTGLLAGLQALARRGLARGERFPLLGLVKNLAALAYFGEYSYLLSAHFERGLCPQETDLRARRSIAYHIWLQITEATQWSRLNELYQASFGRMTTDLGSFILLIGREGKGQSRCKGLDGISRLYGNSRSVHF